MPGAAAAAMPRAVAFLCLACACLVTVTTAGAADGTPSNLYIFRTFFTRGKLFQALWNKAQDELPSPDTRAFVLFDNSTNNATLMDAAFHAAYADRIISVTQAEGRAINGLQKGMKFSVDSTLVLMWRRLRERLSLDRSGGASASVGVDATLPPLAHVDYVWVIESGVCAPGAYGADVSGTDGVMCVVTCCEGCRPCTGCSLCSSALSGDRRVLRWEHGRHSGEGKRRARRLFGAQSGAQVR